MARPCRIPVLLPLLLACACARAPQPRVPRAEVLWPEPPEGARARLALVVPDPAAPARRPSWWRRAFDAAVGLERGAEVDEWFVRPFGVAARTADELFVADPDAPAVLRVVRGRAPEPLACAGRAWAAPMALSLDEAGALWVADAGAGEVIRRAADGRCLALGSGRLERPTGVAVRGGRVFVADPPSHAVVVLSLDGAEVARLGGRGNEEGRLSFPSSLALAPDGSLLVVDALNFRIARFAPDGAWLGSFGSEGEDGAGFVRPKAVATGPDGRIYVSDAQRDVVLVFSPEHAFEYALGARGEEPGYFSHPAGVAVVSGTLFVADSLGRRIQAFELVGGRT